jgi:hypothetical protein
MELVTTSHEHAASSYRRMGPPAFWGADIPADRRLAEFENTLALIKLDPEENVPLLAPLLDIPLPPRRALALSPAELRRRQLANSASGAGVEPIRQRSTYWEASPSAARLYHCSSP